MKKKMVTLLLVLLVACGCMAGCGNSADDTKSSKGGTTELTLWCSYTEASTTVLQQMVDRFNEEFDEYHMTIENAGTVVQFRTKLSTMRKADYPSVFFGINNAIREYKESAYTVPIQQYLDKDKEKWTDDIYENVRESYSDLDGNMIGSPLGVSARGYMVNLTALEGAGYKPEDITSFEKLAAASQAAVDKGLVKYGYCAGDGSDIYDILLYQGVDITDAGNGYSGDITKTMYDQGDTYQALKKLLTLQSGLYKNNVGYVNTGGTQGGLSLFTSGSLLFWTCTNSFVYEIEDMNLGFEWGFIPHVGVDENAAYKNCAKIEGTGMFIANTGNEAEMQGAYEFIKYAARPENQVFWATYRGYVPYTQAAAEHEDWVKYQQEVFPASVRLIEMIQNTPEEFKFPYINVVSQIGSANSDLNNYVMTQPDGDLDGYISQAAKNINESIEILNMRGQ